VKAAIKNLTSIFLMLIFTLSGFVVLGVSIVLVVAESLASTVLTQATALKKGNSKESPIGNYSSCD
jgi:hypothetical protein